MPKAAEYEYVVRVSEPDAPSSWIYLGSTNGRSTTAADTPASTFIPPSLATLPTFQLQLFDGIDPVLNPRSSIGAVVLRDPTGVLDTYATYVLDGGILELRRGTPGATLAPSTSVGTFSTAGLLYDHDTKEIRLHNLARVLETSALHDDRYTGAGGANGDSTLTGIIKPYCVGQVYRVPAVQINQASRIFQVSCTPIQSIDAVTEGGAALTFSGSDRANYAALAAATITPGFYDTCLAEGMIRLGASPTWDITVDLKGDKTGGTYVSTRGDIAKRIVTRAGIALTAGQVDATALSALNTAKPAICGYYWGKEITKAAALTEVMEGCLGYWYVDLAGSLKLGYLTAPLVSPAATYVFGDQTGVPSMKEAVQPPRWKTSISYQRNYFPQERGRLAGIVTDALASIYAQDAQWASDENATTYAKYPTAFEKRILSGLWSSADAATEAAIQEPLFSTPKTRWRMAIYEDPFTLAGYIGQVIRITGYTRYGWAGSRDFRLIGVEWGPDLIPIATLWV